VPRTLPPTGDRGQQREPQEGSAVDDEGQREAARHLALLAADGRLRDDNADRAATHFLALTTAGLNLRDRFELPGFGDCDVAQIVESGVDAFLHGYAG
jgi:hypothetical protein